MILEVVGCDYCGFKHVIPIPDQDELDEYYKKRYHETSKGALLLENKSQNKTEEEHLILKYNDILSYIQSYAINKEVLDVGCASGHLLLFLKENGFNSYGIEPSEKEVEKAVSRGLDVRKGTAETMQDKYDSLKFGVILLNHVIEHVRHPKLILKNCHDLLTDSGIIIAQVPNDFSPIQLSVKNTAKANWWISPPEHLNYFNKESITSLLEKSGFEILHFTATFPIDMFLLMGDDYTSDSKLGKEVYLRTANFELGLYKNGQNSLRKKILKELANLEIGRDFIIVARKKTFNEFDSLICNRANRTITK